MRKFHTHVKICKNSNLWYTSHIQILQYTVQTIQLAQKNITRYQILVIMNCKHNKALKTCSPWLGDQNGLSKKKKKNTGDNAKKKNDNGFFNHKYISRMWKSQNDVSTWGSIRENMLHPHATVGIISEV